MLLNKPELADRQIRMLGIRHDPEDVSRRNRSIYESVLASGGGIDAGNFTVITTFDLEILFKGYDREFFGGLLNDFLEADGATIGFRLSNRMTRSGGTTERLRSRSGMAPRDRYTIAVSTCLLYESFQDPARKVVVGGLECADRLEALQRIFEHELLHLAEFLAWGVSSCAARNFQALSQRIFAHEGVTHQLVTPREVAATAYDIRTGDRVAFEYEGVSRVGLVNRITKRATVLVESPEGRMFSNGVKYATFYVPVSLLRKEATAR